MQYNGCPVPYCLCGVLLLDEVSCGGHCAVGGKGEAGRGGKQAKPCQTQVAVCCPQGDHRDRQHLKDLKGPSLRKWRSEKGIGRVSAAEPLRTALFSVDRYAHGLVWG